MSGPAPFVVRHPGRLEAPGVAIVVAKYHGEITRSLLDGALKAYAARYGGSGPAKRPGDAGPRVVEVAGAFELPQMCSFMMAYSRHQAVVALGCIVRGETSHDRILSDAVTTSLCQLSVEVPVGLGVLTVDTLEQARERAGGAQGNKGADAMNAVLDTLEAQEKIAQELGPPDAYADGFDDADDEPEPPPAPRFKPRRKESR